MTGSSAITDAERETHTMAFRPPRASHPSDPRPERTETDSDGLPAATDDAVIGRAFRRSLLFLAAVGLVAGAAYWLLTRPEPPAPESPIATAPPVEARRPAEVPELRLTDVTAAAGLDFVHHNGARGEKLLPETMGGGAAFFDYDNDGDPDLLLTNGAPWPHDPAAAESPTPSLYRNEGGRFVDVTREAGLSLSFYGMGVAVGDMDGDGWRDLFLTAVGANHLLRNRGGRFEEVTAQAGVAGRADEWSTSAAFFDYDNDGDLDLFVGNYVRWSPEIDHRIDYRLTGVGRAYGPPVNYEGTYPYLYRNDGDGTFTDVSAAAGVRIDNPATGLPVAKTLGLAPVDVDRDGWIDLLVANDTVRNFLLHNQGDGTFREVGEFWGVAYDRNGAATGAMGADSAYFRNDGDLGFGLGNFANEMTSFYVSQGDPTLFADEAIPEGIGAASRTALSFGLVFLDVDLDGRLDLLQANGHLEEEIATVDPSQSYRQAAQLFWNAGNESGPTFVAVDPAATGDLATPLVGRGATYADVDGDGDLDVLLTQVAGPPLLLRNDQRLGHHWVRLRLVGEGGNREAIGARVELRVAGSLQRRQVMPTRSYLSQVELPITFGLGGASRIDELVVIWPDGTRQTVEGVLLDTVQEIHKES